MPEFWTKPVKVRALRWYPDQGVLPGLTPVGCAVCGPGFGTHGYLSACVNRAAHDPWQHPHHLLVGTGEGERALFAGWWLVQFPDQTARVYAPEDFAAQFTSLPLLDVLTHFRDSLLAIADPRGVTAKHFGGNYAARSLSAKTLDAWERRGAV